VQENIHRKLGGRGEQPAVLMCSTCKIATLAHEERMMGRRRQRGRKSSKGVYHGVLGGWLERRQVALLATWEHLEVTVERNKDLGKPQSFVDTFFEGSFSRPRRFEQRKFHDVMPAARLDRIWHTRHVLGWRDPHCTGIEKS
jgi:hypothetical protein